MNELPTPKTDAAVAGRLYMGPQERKLVDLCRDLERENVKLMAERDRAENACVQVRLTGSMSQAINVAAAMDERDKREGA